MRKSRQHATSGEKVAAAWVAWKKEKAAAKLAKKKPRRRKKRSEPKAIPASGYHAYIASAAWREKRASVIQLAGGKCSVCGTRHKLQVHHKHYRTVGIESPEDLLRLPLARA